MAHHDEHDPQHDLPDRRRRAWLRGLVVLLSLPLLRVSGMAPLAVAGPIAAAAPDFSAVTNKAAAERLVRAGQLVEITLFPTELGGPEEPRNLSYITPEAAVVRSLVIGTLRRFFEDDVMGLIDVVGADRVVFGSDWPHAEGLADPTSFIKEIDSVSDADAKKIMHDNARQLVTPRAA